MYPTRSRIFPASLKRSNPSTRPCPLSGLRIPASIRSVVVFPPPFAPTRPNTSPARSSSVSFSTATRCVYHFVTSSTATRISPGSDGVTLFSSMLSSVNIVEPAEHILSRFRSQDEYGSTGFEARPQLGEGQPDRGRARVTQTLGVDEYVRRLDTEEGAQKLRHVPVRLMGDDVVHRLDTGP